MEREETFQLGNLLFLIGFVYSIQTGTCGFCMFSSNRLEKWPDFAYRCATTGAPAAWLFFVLYILVPRAGAATRGARCARASARDTGAPDRHAVRSPLGKLDCRAPACLENR